MEQRDDPLELFGGSERLVRLEVDQVRGQDGLVGEALSSGQQNVSDLASCERS